MLTAKNLGKAVLVLLILALIYFDEAWTFYPDTASIAQMDIRVENSLVSQAPYHLLWFGQQDQTLKLHYNELLGEQPLSLYALTKQEAIVTVPPGQSRTAYCLDKEYSGTIAAVLPPVRLELGRDEPIEQIHLSAKVDTLFTQGFTPVRTIFGDSRIPLEVCFKGNRAIMLLYQTKPLCNQEIRLVSRRKFGFAVDQKVTTDAAGMLQVKDFRDLRTGISIIYRAGERVMYISSYRLEANSLFTKRYLKALDPLQKVLQWSVLLCLLLVAWRKIYCRLGQAGQTAKLVGGMPPEWFTRSKPNKM
jgi:hypothetical protein